MQSLLFAVCTHGFIRMAQRGYTLENILYVLKHGTTLREGPEQVIVLRTLDVPTEDRRRFGHLAGTKIVLREGVLLTVYKNRRKFA